MTTRNWSKYQQAIFAHVSDPKAGNAIIEAVAGSGKSTTIVEAMRLVPPMKQSIFLAFNKAIATELASRGVPAKTFHSLTYSPVTRARGARTITANKLRLLVNEHLPDLEVAMYGNFIIQLVGFGRSVGIGCLIDDTAQAWMDLINHHDIELESNKADMGKAITYASQLLAWSNADKRVDFDDLLYLAVKDGLALQRFDYIFVDEAQDTNAIQRAILRKIVKTDSSSRIIAVGDPAQAIYGFRGADSDSLGLIGTEFDCKRLPLSVTYRCPLAVVELAKAYVPHLEAADNAAPGTVKRLGDKWALEDFGPRDLIVCRTNKPLIALGYQFLKAGIKAYIMGREIGVGLKTLITKQRATTVDELSTSIEAWAQRECEKAIAKKQAQKESAINDKADAILFLIDALPEDDRTIRKLLDTIDALFSDTTDAIVLASIHKAKGLEAKRVAWLNSSQCPAKWAKTPWQREQEDNLCYVAITRAIDELWLIEEARDE